MFMTWQLTATTDPYEHKRNLEPGETRRRLARAKHEEEITMYTHQHLFEPAIKAKNIRLANEALIANQIRLTSNENPGRITTITTSIRRSIGTILIATGERLQPEDSRPHRKNRPDTVMQA